MAYWHKRKWLPRYQCKKLMTGMIQRPKWCRECEDRYCNGCQFKEVENEKATTKV